METFPVDIDAEQVVRWIMTEQSAAPSTFKTTATSVRPKCSKFRSEENIISVTRSAKTYAKWRHWRLWRSRLRMPDEGWLLTVTC